MTTKRFLPALNDAFLRSFKLTPKRKVIGHNALIFAVRPLAAVMILLLFPLAGYAYSLVLRNGRRLEIPDRFVVSQSTLIYEAAPGMSVSLQIATIDIEATERANREAPGSFLTHQAVTTHPVEPNATVKRSQGPAKNVTNQDLEKFERERLKNDETYDREYKQRGLPSREELKRREQESEQRLRQLASEVDAERARTEALQAQLDMLAMRQLSIPGYQGLPYGNYDGWSGWPSAIVLDGGFGRGRLGRGFNSNFGFGQFDRGFDLNFGFGQFDRGFFGHENRFRIIRPPRGLFPGGFFGGRSGTPRMQRSPGVIGTGGMRMRR
jgi:hypothetical protein